MSENRIYKQLDSARFFFALLVVVNHIRPPFFNDISPIVYCAVPFFFMLTGFFIYNDGQQLRNRLEKCAKNYGRLWIKYLIQLSIILFSIRCITGEKNIFEIRELVDLFWTYGNCKTFDTIVLNNTTYGTSALWYLYSGMVSMLLLLVCKKRLYTKQFAFIILLIEVSYVVANHTEQTPLVPRTIGASLPYIYIGILLRKYEKLVRKLKLSIVLFSTTATLIFLYVECWYLGSNAYATFMLLPTSICMFIFILNFWGGISGKYSSQSFS